MKEAIQIDLTIEEQDRIVDVTFDDGSKEHLVFGPVDDKPMPAADVAREVKALIARAEAGGQAAQDAELAGVPVMAQAVQDAAAAKAGMAPAGGADQATP